MIITPEVSDKIFVYTTTHIRTVEMILTKVTAIPNQKNWYELEGTVVWAHVRSRAKAHHKFVVRAKVWIDGLGGMVGGDEAAVKAWPKRMR